MIKKNRKTGMLKHLNTYICFKCLREYETYATHKKEEDRLCTGSDCWKKYQERKARFEEAERLKNEQRYNINKQ